MVDPVVPIQTITPAPVDPVVQAVQAAPAVVTPESPAPVAPVVPPVGTPAVAPVPAPVEASPAPIVEAPKPAPTLLTPEPAKPVETAPVEPPKAPDTQNTEGGQSVEPAPPPTYEPFTLPEDVQLDQARMGDFTNILAELEINKGDHKVTQQVGQKLVDFHINELKNTVNRINEQAMTTWNNQLQAWQDDVRKDPVIGGERFEATINNALEFIRTHGGTAEEQAELRAVMDSSGIGNHKAVIRVFANAMSAMREGSPLVAHQPPAPPKSRVATFYGSNT